MSRRDISLEAEREGSLKRKRDHSRSYSIDDYQK